MLRFSPRAIGDIAAIAEYIRQRNARAALRVEQAIRASLEHLDRHPYLGVARPHLGVRALGVPRYPYTIYYRVEDQVVVIVHVRDDRRTPLRPGDL